jgi:hypothetical protein
LDRLEPPPETLHIHRQDDAEEQQRRLHELEGFGLPTAFGSTKMQQPDEPPPRRRQPQQRRHQTGDYGSADGEEQRWTDGGGGTGDTWMGDGDAVAGGGYEWQQAYDAGSGHYYYYNETLQVRVQ